MIKIPPWWGGRRYYMKADKAKTSNLIKTAKGQLEGILKMIEEDRYCIDISTQLLATIAILKKANCDVLNAHLHHCLKNGEDIDKKVDEVADILNKLSR